MSERNRLDPAPDAVPGVRSADSSRRALLEAAASGGAGLSLAGCLDTYERLTGSDGEGPVTIGLLAPDPGSNFVGQSMKRGGAVAVAELNERGGIGGREVELIVGDTNGSPLEARRQYQQLTLEADADVTVGVFDSRALVNIIDDVAEQERIHLTTGAATSTVSRLIREAYGRYKYHFRVGPVNDRDIGRGLLDFLDDAAGELGWESVALLAEDYDWTEGPWAVYRERFDEIALDVVLEERYPPSIDDFSGIYDAAAAAGADAALVTTAHTGTDALLDWVRPEPRPFAFGGIHVPMQRPSYYERTNGACRYGFSQISATPRSDVGDRTEAFVTAYREMYDGSTPVYTGYHTYDAIMLFAEAVEDAGTFSHRDLVPALEETTFSGAAGTIEFYDRFHDYPHDPVYSPSETLYIQWQENEAGEGVREVIWPDEHATGEYVSPDWL